ncbi:MAG TPA: serine/threonine-protein kinase [Thermoleophilaceae bacterium]|nr:serine/threonine-protein kinase [Thermoleophilaceae bacterium]
MKRPEFSRSYEDGTLPLGGSDPTQALPGAPGPRLVLGRYRLERRLGAGGFGVVWLGWDEKLEREVAVKAIPHETGHGERVEREARAAARLNHPGIVGVYELAADEHDVYLVSELVRGRTLAELMKAGAIADRDVARIGIALCDALEHAHAHGVIHRDVKPGNVMVVADPAAGAGFAKLADFGVAHVVSDNPLTMTGDVVGTLAYMAPEQAEGQRVGPAADVYSLALTLYEAWTGTNPIRSGGIAATARRLGQPLPSLADRRPDLPIELCDAIDDSLEIEPERRLRAGELRAELERAERKLDEEGGLVEPATLMRVGLPASDTRRRAAKPELSRPGAIARRIGAGALAGGIVLGVLETLGPDPTFSAPAAAGIAALAVALLPRVAWLVVAMALCGWLAAPETDRQGTALILAAAALPIPLLLPRAGLLWSVPVLAPLLGTIALGPAFIGAAALASTAWRRAGLAAAGFLWLALAEVLTGKDLLYGVADGTLARHEWQQSISSAAGDGLGPLLSGPALAPIVVWAAFAVLLPLLVRGRWLAADLLGAGLWTVGLVVTLTALGDMLAATTMLSQPRGAVAGAIGAALIVVGARQMAPEPEPLTPPGAESVSTA